MINKIDLLICCDWLSDRDVDCSVLRVISSVLVSGVVGVGVFGYDIDDGDGGEWLSSGYLGIGSYYGLGDCGSVDGDGAGFDDSQMYDYWDRDRCVVDGCGSGDGFDDGDGGGIGIDFGVVD